MCKPADLKKEKHYPSHMQRFKQNVEKQKNLTTSSRYDIPSFTRILASTAISYLVILKLLHDRSPHSKAHDPSSVYVPGAGFSGFWFTLGRLQSIERPYEKNYYCFSAGCLGVVARLTNSTVNDMMDYALNAQQLWAKGEISRYEVASEFIDKLISIDDRLNSTQNLIFDRINIVTTTYGVGMNIRRPKNAEELREMLIQTTFIPFATGFGIAKSDQIGNWHVDGGFTFPFHPKCETNLNLPLQFDLILNILNPSLSEERALEFWSDGMAYGS